MALSSEASWLPHPSPSQGPCLVGGPRIWSSRGVSTPPRAAVPVIVSGCSCPSNALRPLRAPVSQPGLPRVVVRNQETREGLPAASASSPPGSLVLGLQSGSWLGTAGWHTEECGSPSGILGRTIDTRSMGCQEFSPSVCSCPSLSRNTGGKLQGTCSTVKPGFCLWESPCLREAACLLLDLGWAPRRVSAPLEGCQGYSACSPGSTGSQGRLEMELGCGWRRRSRETWPRGDSTWIVSS